MAEQGLGPKKENARKVSSRLINEIKPLRARQGLRLKKKREKQALGSKRKYCCLGPRAMA